MTRKKYQTATLPVGNVQQLTTFETPEAPKQPPASVEQASPRAQVGSAFYCADCGISLPRNFNRTGPYLAHPPGQCKNAGKLFEMPSVRLQEIASQ